MAIKEKFDRYFLFEKKFTIQYNFNWNTLIEKTCLGGNYAGSKTVIQEL